MEVILTTIQMLWGGAYLIIVGGAVWIEHRLVGQKWRRHELSRRIMGIVTVMGLAVPLLFMGLLDWGTWIILMCGYGVAGVIIGFSKIWEISNEEEAKRDELHQHAQTTFERGKKVS